MYYSRYDYIPDRFDSAAFDREIKKERKAKSNGKACAESTSIYNIESIFEIASYTLSAELYE